MRILVVLLFGVSLAASTGLERLGHWFYGPNLRHRAEVDVPVDWGVWVPRAQYGLRFDWLEPLRANRPHGTPLELDPLFLRWQMGMELSPYFAGVSTALGFQFIRRVELRLLYANRLFLGSNVPMGMEGREHLPPVAETWRGDYIFDRMYEGKWSDQMQNFGFWIDVDLSASLFKAGLATRYTLVDVSTEYDSKSMDYERGIPIYSRDFVMEFHIYASVPVHERWDILLNGQLMTTGWIRDLLGNYTKEPLRQSLFLSGASWWPNGRSRELRTYLQGGFWQRPEKHYSGPISEQLLIQIGFDYAWNLNLSL